MFSSVTNAALFASSSMLILILSTPLTRSLTAGSDFIPFSVSITLPVNTPNDTRSCTVLNIVDDSELEQREYVSISIDNITPDVVTVLEGQDELIVRILDDDSK